MKIIVGNIECVIAVRSEQVEQTSCELCDFCEGLNCTFPEDCPLGYLHYFKRVNDGKQD